MVVDEHKLVRQAIVKILSEDEQLEVVGEAATGFDAVSKAATLDLDAVLMDIYLPELDGVAATRLMRQKLPNVKVVALTASDEESDVFQAIEAGALGYILKNMDSKFMLDQLKLVLTGGVAITDDMKAKLVAGINKRGNENGAPSVPGRKSPTPREKEVLGLISLGITNQEIGHRLAVSENTVRAHVKALMQKLELDNRTQLAVFGVHNGYAATSRGARAKLGGNNLPT